MENTKILIIGTGAWGTALAISLHNAGKNVALWGRRKEHVEKLCADRESTYLPGITIPETLSITNDVAEIAIAKLLLWTAPVQQSRELIECLSTHMPQDCPIVVCSKGLELQTQKPISEIFKESLPNSVGMLSGPNFADEIAKDLPAASTLAFKDLELAKNISYVLRHKAFRVYAYDDVIGVELAGALKNVIAIAAGIVMGKNFGQNCLATLITRANVEISRIICALGGERDTTQTLAGIGDLMLTCSSEKSRNTSLGISLAHGLSLEEILNTRKNITEGVPTTKVAFELAGKHKIHAPIICAVYDILYAKKPIDDVLEELFSTQHDRELE
ncbi:MAG: NAD(P)H-dependent glycerol-3-phosphate dehydrogenase [Pseudomonadota bacterium]|nr:NAD(P)-dependent glycerol-3-phosphate dehydrogenase [Alphaproteobacteria bacterium]